MNRKIGKKQNLTAMALIFCFILPFVTYAGEKPSLEGAALTQSNTLLQGYCGRETLRQALESLGVDSNAGQAALAELTKQADARKGYNTLLEIKQAAESCGLHAEGVRCVAGTLKKAEQDAQRLSRLKECGELIVNITGNRHFALIKEVNENGIRLYIPGLNCTEPQLSWEEFARTWDGVALLIAHSATTLTTNKAASPCTLLEAKQRSELLLVSDAELARIYGGQPCGNISGSGNNGAGRSVADSSVCRAAAATAEPVILNNGNLFLTAEDIVIPTRGFPLKLKRYYNAQVVSEVTGWAA